MPALALSIKSAESVRGCAASKLGNAQVPTSIDLYNIFNTNAPQM